jgi:uncharacterized protein
VTGRFTPELMTPARMTSPPIIPLTDSSFIGLICEHEREGGMLLSHHSCGPNIGVQGRIVCVAMRDVQAGEELTQDRATIDDEAYERPCHWGG